MSKLRIISLNFPSSTKIDLILARRFKMTMNRYWWRHAGLPMANGWWNIRFYI